MTADQSSLSSRDTASDSRMSSSLQSNVKKFAFAHIREAIALSVSGVVLLFGAATWNTWQLYQNFESSISEGFKLKDLSDKIVYFDEVLTMSARMSASTGDSKWAERYAANEPELTSAIEEVTALIPDIAKTQTAQTDQANTRLIEIETKAFELVEAGQKEEAFDLLLGPEYQKQKDIYAQGIQETLKIIEEEVRKIERKYHDQLQSSLIFSGLSLPLLALSIFIVAWLIRTYLQDRQRAEKALQVSQQSLVSTNQELTDKIKMVQRQTQKIQEQEQETALESELLQNDIAHLLDVLSDLEDGNFRVEAEVSDRVTGLVADTLNRLIENLSATLAQVAQTATIASQGSGDVKDYAQSVAQDVDQQAKDVTVMLNLSETVWQSAQEAIAKIEQTQQILTEVKSSVEHGQGAMGQMTEGIETLQTGSNRMVQRIKTLGEFVSLADQFVQEQNQTAALTQVLALNASLVAAKAAEQRDPEKFQQVAYEFETIAKQVQQLAQQTNTGLESLQQRTLQIHGVVSDVDREVQGLNLLVNNFSAGVMESSQAFSTVQEKTIEVERSGQAVEEGNLKIMQAAENTRLTLQDVTQRAQRTTTRMQSTLQSSKRMKEIASQLLERVQVFTLPVSVSQGVPHLKDGLEEINLPAPHFSSDDRSPVSDEQEETLTLTSKAAQV